MQAQHSNPLDEHYRKIGKIGSGSYGDVLLYQRKATKREYSPLAGLGTSTPEGQMVAVKIYRRPNNNREGVDFTSLREINCLQQVRHPNVINCNEVIYRMAAPHLHQVCVVMNFHIELADLLKVHHAPSDKLQVAKHITKGLHYLHQNFIFHRDMKPENIFISRDGQARIGDFGFAKEFGTPYKRCTINACTIEYRAPEVFMKTHYYTEKSDVWSLGCIFAYLFTGKALFDMRGKNELQLLMEIFWLRGTPDEENWTGSDKLPCKFKFQPTEQPKNLKEKLELGE